MKLSSRLYYVFDRKKSDLLWHLYRSYYYSPLRHSIYFEYDAATRHLLSCGVKKESINAGLILACTYRRRVDIIYDLIYYGASVDYNNGAALFYASSNNSYDIVRILVENGANIYIDNYSAFISSIITYSYDVTEYLYPFYTYEELELLFTNNLNIREHIYYHKILSWWLNKKKQI
jgi:hypothetical protein